MGTVGGAGGNLFDGLASHPGGVKILLVASCYRNQDKSLPDGSLGSYIVSGLNLPYLFNSKHFSV